MEFILSLFVFIITSGACAVFIIRRFPIISSIKINDEAGEIIIRAKQAIIEQRVRRRMSTFWKRIRKRLIPLAGVLRERWTRVRIWADEVERRYEENLEQGIQASGSHMFPTAEECITEAERLTVAGDDEGAEKMALRAVALDQKYIPAYKLLSRMYASRKEYHHVREICGFLLKLDAHQADVYADLSNALIALGESDLALDAIDKAVLIEEGNPKYLDQLLELAILRKQKAIALDALEKLKEANPENEKIPLFQSRIQEISSNQAIQKQK